MIINENKMYSISVYLSVSLHLHLLSPSFPLCLSLSLYIYIVTHTNQDALRSIHQMYIISERNTFTVDMGEMVVYTGKKNGYNMQYY